MAVMLVQDNGFIRTRMCRCQRDIPTKFTLALGEYLSRRFLGGPLTAVTVAAMQEILLELGEAGLAVAPILSAFYELALECSNAKTALTGQMNLLRHPDYDIDRARILTQFLTDHQKVADLLELAYAREGTQIYLGGELYPELGGSCLVLTRYHLGKQGQGVIGIIGPNRMDYAAVIPRLEYFAAHLGRLMSELFEETEALDFG
jgi:heat-inducible transcriptional repressor